MAAFSLTDPEIYVGAYDLTSDLKSINGSYNPNFLDTTNFGSGGWRNRIQGLIDVDFTAEGFNDFSATGVDANTYPLMGSISVCTVSLTNNGANGEPAYLFQALQCAQAEDATLGETANFGLTFKGKSQMVSGKMQAARASRTATATSTAVQMGTSSNGQLFATRNIFTVTGNSPTLATFVQSATNSSMLGAVTRASFSTASAVGGEWISSQTVSVTAGSWWNVSWVIGGTGTPTFDFAVALSVR